MRHAIAKRPLPPLLPFPLHPLPFEGEFDVEIDERSAFGVKTAGAAVDFTANYVR